MRAIAAMLVACTLAACDTPGRPPIEPTGPIPWTAAIGRLDVGVGACTATLVKPDIIITAAHCLFPEGKRLSPSSITFTPNYGKQRLPAAHVAEIVGIGVEKMNPDDENDQTPREDDWAILRLSQPITNVTPIPVEAMELEDIDRRVKAGESLSNLGYGSYGISSGRHLNRIEECTLVSDWRSLIKDEGRMLITTCPVIPVIKGDSGGPIVITDQAEKRRLVAVISGYWIRPNGPVSLAVSATQFDEKL